MLCHQKALQEELYLKHSSMVITIPLIHIFPSDKELPSFCSQDSHVACHNYNHHIEMLRPSPKEIIFANEIPTQLCIWVTVGMFPEQLQFNLRKELGLLWQQQISEHLEPFADLLKIQYWWQLATVQSLASLTCTDVQQKQLPVVAHFAISNRQPKARHRQCLTLTCTRFPPKSTKPTHSVSVFRLPSTSQLALQATQPKGRYQQVPVLGSMSTHHSSSHSVFGGDPHSQPA